MKRLIWLIGTFSIGAMIAVGSWLAVRDLTPVPVLAAQPPAAQLQPAPAQVQPPAAPTVQPNNFNDNEAPPHTGEPEKQETFIGSLRQLIEDTPELRDELEDEHITSLEEAEEQYLKIKRENAEAWKRVNRRPPLSVPQSPNFIVIDAPGLGYADLASFSQEVEPGLAVDRLAQSGLVFTHYYTASPSTAANSCAMLTSLHTGRTRIRGEEPAVPLALDDITVAETLWRAGYATSMAGQWRLGGARTSGAPFRQGFEEAWYTDLHGENGELVVWSDDRQAEDKDQPTDMTAFRESIFNRTVGFIDRHRAQPFFAYISLPAAGEDSEAAWTEIDGHVAKLNAAVTDMNLRRETYFFLLGSAGQNIPASEKPPEVVAVDPDLAQLGDPAAVPPEPHPPARPLKIIPGAKPPESRPAPTVEVIETEFPAGTNANQDAPKAEAADGDESVATLPADETTEDAKPALAVPIMELDHLRTETARDVAGLRGKLGELYEGGLRAPLIVWTIHRPLGGVRHDVVAAWDLLPTLAGLSYSQFVPTHANGVPFSDRLQVNGSTANLPLHPALYWETHEDGFARAFLFGQWKLIQIGEDGPVSLYNLMNDPEETRDVSQQQSELVEKLVPLLDRVRTKSRHWPREGEEPPQK